MTKNKDGPKEKVYWMLLEKGVWKIYISATDDGLCYVGSSNAPFDELAT